MQGENETTPNMFYRLLLRPLVMYACYERPHPLFEKLNFEPNKIVYPFNGWTYLHYACFAQHLNVLVGLVACGADVGQVDNFQNTPLSIACNSTGVLTTSFGRPNDLLNAKFGVVILMQPQGRATINNVNHVGDTVLHVAVQRNNVWFVSFLLLCGADPTLRNDKGQCPADVDTRSWVSLRMKKQLRRILHDASLYRELGEWRIVRHLRFPLAVRQTIKTLLMLWYVKGRGETEIVTDRPSCLFMLPVELLDYLLVFVADAVRWHEPVELFRYRPNLAAFARNRCADLSIGLGRLPSSGTESDSE
jgi:hypothetical protein